MNIQNYTAKCHIGDTNKRVGILSLLPMVKAWVWLLWGREARTGEISTSREQKEGPTVIANVFSEKVVKTVTSK